MPEEERKNFDEWFVELQELVRKEYGFTQEDIDMMAHEFDYWNDYYEKGFTIEKALMYDRNED